MREESDESDWANLLWMPSDLGLGGLAAAVALAVFAVVLVVLLRPLIGLVLELTTLPRPAPAD